MFFLFLKVLPKKDRYNAVTVFLQILCNYFNIFLG